MLKTLSSFAKIFGAAALLAAGIFMLTNANASVISHKMEPGKVVFKLDRGLMEVIVCKDDIIEIKYTIFDSFPTKPSLVVNNKWKYATFRTTENKDAVIITTDRMKVLVNKATNAVTYTDLAGNEIASESQPITRPLHRLLSRASAPIISGPNSIRLKMRRFSVWAAIRRIPCPSIIRVVTKAWLLNT